MRAKREKRLEKAGYKTEKGVFGSKYVGDTFLLKFKSKKSKYMSKSVQVAGFEQK